MENKGNNFLLIVGESGSGKTLTAEKLCKKFNLEMLDSYTTRPPRYKGEKGHTFVSKEEFDKLENIIAYLNRYDHEYCGTSEQVDSSDIYVLDPEAALKFKNNYKGNKRIFVIYIKSNVDTRLRNMTKRGDTYNNAMGRIIDDIEPYKDFENKADIIIENDGDVTIEEIADIIYYDIFTL